jgi:hypothetical protein
LDGNQQLPAQLVDFLVCHCLQNICSLSCVSCRLLCGNNSGFSGMSRLYLCLPSLTLHLGPLFCRFSASLGILSAVTQFARKPFQGGEDCIDCGCGRVAHKEYPALVRSGAALGVRPRPQTGYGPGVP